MSMTHFWVGASHSSGKERDAESGLDYFGARYYGSTMGRFMSPDPVFISAQRLADPQSLNLYAYVRNNPLRLTDDTGLDFYLACATSDHSGCGGAGPALHDHE
jgi:RHS repeat-associated protein